MTGGPRTAPEPHRRRRAGLAAALLVVLGALAGQGPAAGQTSAAAAPRPCAAQDAASRESCANLPLDAFRTRKPPPPPDPANDNPLRPVGRPAELAAARIGQAYPPAQLAIGGVRPYAVRTYGLPPSLRVTADGFLVGRPAPGDAGDYPFGAIFRDAEGQEIRQYYRLRILGPARPAPQPAPKGPAPVLAPVKLTPARTGPAELEGRITVYVLRQADVMPVGPANAVPPPPPPPPPEPAAVRAPGGKVTIVLPLDTPQSAAYPADLAIRARSMINVEYPTRDLFKRALASNYLTSPLSPTQLEKVADAAREVRDFSNAPKLNWAPEAGCGCALPIGQQAKTVYGFFPFWRSDEPPPSIVFSRVSRIGFLGVQLSSDGSWTKPSGYGTTPEMWWRQTSTFARAAHAHGARLDLVVQRSDWRFLMGLDDVERTAMAESAARTAVDLADTPLRNRGLSLLLLPFWKEPRYVFDGVTVMFDWPDDASTEEVGAYVHFHDAFIRQLIREMQASGRPYVLNIVAPDPLGTAADIGGLADDRMDESSIWRAFLSYKRMAEPQAFHRAAPPEDRVRFLGRTKIRVNLIAPLREPTSASKKAIRAGIDQLKDVKGYNRVAVVQSILPVLYLPAGGGPYDPTPPWAKPTAKPKDKPVVRTKDEKSRLDDDIIYFKQNFGGVALWPAPIQKVGNAEEVYDDLERVFFQPDSAPTTGAKTALAKVKLLPGPTLICSLVLRLLWQVLVLVVIGCVAAYMIWGQISGRAVLYRRGLLVLALGLAALSYFLLTVDPALAELSRGNGPLIVLLVGAVAATGWFTVKPRIPRP